MNILLTGTSGFIGFNTAKVLLERGDTVIWVDNENDYYDVSIKHVRRALLEKYENFHFHHVSLQDQEWLAEVFRSHQIDRVCNLAAQAWVRYSIKNPRAYLESNLIGFFNIIDLAREYKVQNFVYASSSSIYGTNKKQPFSVDDKTDSPMAMYAASKKANELIAHSYSHAYSLPTTGLRFFTVYGPYGRPDMMMLIFANKILKGEPIDVFNYGKMQRDFTYIDDIVAGVIQSIDTISACEVFNLGSDAPVELEYVIELIEKNLGKKAIKNYLPIQLWDVPATWADIDHTKEKLAWSPKVSVEIGVENTMAWFKSYRETHSLKI
jgi:UDP-glucuronate 4-epimerase